MARLASGEDSQASVVERIIRMRGGEIRDNTPMPSHPSKKIRYLDAQHRIHITRAITVDGSDG